MDQFAEDTTLALDHSIQAEEGVPAIGSLTIVGEHSPVEVHESAHLSLSVRRYIE